MSYFEINGLAVFTPFEETPQIRRDKMGVLLYLDEVIKELEVIIKSRRVGKVLASNGCLSLAVTKSKLRDYTVEAWVIAKRSSQRRKLEAKRSLREILPESGRVKPANTPMSKHEVLTRLSVMQEQLITANQAITNLVANTLQELDAKIADIKRDLLN